MAYWDGTHATAPLAANAPDFIDNTPYTSRFMKFTHIDKLMLDEDSNRLYFLDMGRVIALEHVTDPHSKRSMVSTIFTSTDIAIYTLCTKKNVLYQFTRS